MAAYYQIIGTKPNKEEVVLDTQPTRSCAKQCMKELDKTGYDRVRIMFVISSS